MLNRTVTRVLATAAATSSIIASSVLFVASPPVAADTIQSEQARAGELVGLIQSESARISTLANAYDGAQLQAKTLASQLQGARIAAEAARQRMARASSALRANALIAYMTGGPSSGLMTLLQQSAVESAVSSAYIGSAALSEQDSIDRLALARQKYEVTTASLVSAERAADANAAQLRTTAAQAQNAVAGEQATLAQVTGRLGDLVAQAQLQAAAVRQTAAAARIADSHAGGPSASLLTPLVQRPNEPPVGSPPQSPTSPPQTSGGAAAAVAFAEAQVGKPYQWGGEGPNSYDCSGLVKRSWQAGGVSLDHYTVSQYNGTARISVSDLQPGDIVFWQFPGEAWPGHDGLYIGNNKVVVADTAGTPVRIESMYYDGNPVGFGRVY